MAVLSFSAKWLKGKQITRGWGKKKNDKTLIKEVWKLLNEVDILVTQNGRAFDLKLLNARFLFYGLKPPKPYKNIDLKIEAKKYLRLPSYSLDDMCDYFGIGRKLHHEGFALWKACMNGDKKAWKKMLAYNANDVRITELLYLKLLPFMVTHPNYGSYAEKAVCPRCGSKRTQRAGELKTLKNIYTRIRCRDCGAWSKAEKKRSFKVLQSV